MPQKPKMTQEQKSCCRTWNAGGFRGKKTKADDVAFIAKVLDDLATVVNVDPKRVFATGISK